MQKEQEAFTLNILDKSVSLPDQNFLLKGLVKARIIFNNSRPFLSPRSDSS